MSQEDEKDLKVYTSNWSNKSDMYSELHYCTNIQHLQSFGKALVAYGCESYELEMHTKRDCQHQKWRF